MKDEYLDEECIYDEEELIRPDIQGKSRGSERKRKWREIESIKEQRRLRRDLEGFEQYSF